MANINVGNTSIGGLWLDSASGAFRGIAITPTHSGRVVSYSAYYRSLDTDDRLGWGIGKTAAMAGSQLEMMYEISGFTANPAWITRASITKPIIKAGDTYLMYLGIRGTTDLGVGDNTVGIAYDNGVAGQTTNSFARNGGTSVQTPFLEPDGARRFSAYVTIQPIFENNYYYRKEIVVDPTKVGGVADLTNYPMLVSQVDVALKSKANGGNVESASGFDIRFEDKYGNKLAHEIEKYVPTTGELVAWVKMPTLYHLVNSECYLYYGNPDVIVTEANPTAVWDSNYKAVWHLNTANDSTGNANTLTNTGVTLNVAGKIDGAGDYEADENDYMTAADSASLDITGAFTIGCWIKPETTTNGGLYYKATYQQWGSAADKTIDFGFFPSNFVLGIANTVSNYAGAVWGSGPIAGNWYHFVGTWNGVNNHGLSVYVNGVKSTQPLAEDVGDVTSIPVNTETAILGGNNKAGGLAYRYDGLMEEFKLQSVERTEGWIKTEYNNQNSPGTFYTYSAELTPDTVVQGTYQYSRKLIINSSLVFSGPYTNFQVFYENTLPEYKSVNNGGHVWFDSGADISFGGSADPTNLDKYAFQIAEYNPVTGYLAAYVNIPTIQSSIDTPFWILYGDENAVRTQQQVLESEKCWSGEVIHGHETPWPNFPVYMMNDTFTGTDGTLVSTYNPLYVGSGNAIIYGNKLKSNGDGYARYTINKTVGTVDNTIEFDFTSQAAASGSSVIAIYIRKDSTGFNDFYYCELAIPTGANPSCTLTIYKYAGNSPQTMTSTTFNVAASTTHNFKAVYVDHRIRVFWDNVNINNIQFVESSALPSGIFTGFAMSGPAGFAYNSADTFAIDNLKSYSSTVVSVIEDTKTQKALGNGETMASEGVTITTGKVNRSYNINGVMRGLSGFENQNPQTPQTVMVWLYKANVNQGGVYYKGYTSSNLTHTYMGIDASRFPFIATNGSSTPDLQGTTVVPVTTWHHLAYVLDGGTYRIYQNGVQTNSITGRDTSWSTGNGYHFNIGAVAQDTFGQSLNARFDEYHREGVLRSADFIKTYYNSTNSPATFITTNDEHQSGGGGGWVIFGDEGLIGG